MFKKLSIFGISLLGILFLASPVSASSTLKLDSKGQLDPNACGDHGKPVINVEEKVKNDADSGFGGNYWAIDNYTRHIKVWQVGENSWCATVKYEGEFDAAAGQIGPGGTGIIGSDVEGEMRGGYRATFNGTLRSEPLWKTHGLVGTVNYNCDISGNCPGRVSWSSQYFDNIESFDQPWWGWIYKSEEGHGTWLNAINVLAPDSGNIL